MTTTIEAGIRAERPLPITPAMRNVLRDAVLAADGSGVLVFCADKRTRAGLMRRGATKDGVHLRLSPRLIVHAVRLADVAYREALLDPFGAGACVTTHSTVDSGFSTRRTALCWAAVRAGHRKAARGTVNGWGTSYEGWVFPIRHRDYGYC